MSDDKAAVAGLRRRIEQLLGSHADDWTYYRNGLQQALRWLDEHERRTKPDDPPGPISPTGAIR